MSLAAMNCYDEMFESTRTITPSMRVATTGTVDEAEPSVSKKKKGRKNGIVGLSKKADGSIDWVHQIHKARKNQPCKSLQTALVQGIQKEAHLPECLYEGIPVYKFHRTMKGQKMGKRILTLSRDHLAWFITRHKIKEKNNIFLGSTSIVSSSLGDIPFWTPSKGWASRNRKKSTSKIAFYDQYMRFLDIADMNHIQTGVVGNKLLEQPKIYAKVANHDESSLVTIFHHGYTANLNLIIPDAEHRRVVVSAMQSLLQMYQTVVPWMGSTSLLLRYIWYDVDTDRNHNISKKEFQNICSRISLGKKAYPIAKSYDDFLLSQQPTTKKHKLSFGKKKELTYDECMQLLHHIRSDIWTQTESTQQQAQKTKKASTRISLWDDIFGMQEDNITSKLVVTPQEVWQRFLIECQAEEMSTLEDAIHLVQSMQELDLDNSKTSEVVVATNIDNDLVLTKAQFEEFLLSKYNSAYDPTVLRDPTTTIDNNDYFQRPLSQYWINTSHNTYLTGDQLQSKSSVEAYSLALFRGCKCLELDCWDGVLSEQKKKKKKTASLKQKAAPVVFHGHTLTSKISFRSILEVVQNYVEANPSGLPIILSLENHCSRPVQQTMAHDLKEVFGSNLYIPPTEDHTINETLPSPDELRGMVVIKGKRPPDPDDGKNEDGSNTPNDGVEVGIDETGNDQEMNDKEEEEEEDPYDVAVRGSKDEEERSASSVSSASVNEDTKKSISKTKVSKKSKNNKEKQKQKPPKIVPELAKLTLFHGTKYKSFETSIQQAPSHMHSIGENKIPKILSSRSANDNSSSISNLWRQYNHNHMTRTYPAGSRVNSSNYNPTLAWAMGCQLVALNFQSPDPPLLLNDGRFRQAGSTGYVQKATSLLQQPPPSSEDGNAVSPSRESSSTASNPMMIRIQVVSGHCLPKPKGRKQGEEIDPYTVVELHDVRTGAGGGKEEYVSDNFKTDVINNNGFCPTWGWSSGSTSVDGNSCKKKNDAVKNAKTFEVHRPEVAMLLFQVLDDDYAFDDKVASAAIPVNCLREGYRSVQLFDAHCHSRTGPFQYANLLVKVEIM